MSVMELRGGHFISLRVLMTTTMQVPDAGYQGSVGQQPDPPLLCDDESLGHGLPRAVETLLSSSDSQVGSDSNPGSKSKENRVDDLYVSH